MERPTQIKRVTGGAQALFDAVNTVERLGVYGQQYFAAALGA